MPFIYPCLNMPSGCAPLELLETYVQALFDPARLRADEYCTLIQAFTAFLTNYWKSYLQLRPPLLNEPILCLLPSAPDHPWMAHYRRHATDRLLLFEVLQLQRWYCDGRDVDPQLVRAMRVWFPTPAPALCAWRPYHAIEVPSAPSSSELLLLGGGPLQATAALADFKKQDDACGHLACLRVYYLHDSQTVEAPADLSTLPALRGLWLPPAASSRTRMATVPLPSPVT